MTINRTTFRTSAVTVLLCYITYLRCDRYRNTIGVSISIATRSAAVVETGLYSPRAHMQSAVTGS